MSKKMALLILGIIFCLCPACAVNPLTGEEELMFFSIDQDVEIGRKYAPEVENQMGGRIDNNDLQDYINTVGQQIARISHRPTLQYHFIALDHESVNALALPGGYIFVTKGLLEHLQTESQLASVLAHEIAHVVARDTINVISNEIGINILLSAAIIASDKAPPRDVMRVADVTRQILGLRYSRNDEHQADLGGLRYMVRAGYNPHGMIETMQMFEAQQTVRPIEFFSTHPSPENRMAYLTRKIQAKYYNLTGLKIGKEDYRSGVLQHLTNSSP